MKRKFAVLTALAAALVALAIPASSIGASMVPAGHKFEIQGLGATPKLSTSLGSCTISKITSSIPAAPANETSFSSAATVTPGTCSAGTTIAINGSWAFNFSNNYYVNINSTNTEAVVMRFASLPGCKLAGAYRISGLYSNGITGGMTSGFHGESGNGLTWSNDGGSCALAGKVEGISYEARGGTAPNYTPIANWVNDLTAPGTLVLIK